MKILVDHMPDSPRDCFVAGHQNSGNWTCGFQGYVVVCNPERCPYLAEAKSDTRGKQYDDNATDRVIEKA